MSAARDHGRRGRVAGLFAGGAIALGAAWPGAAHASGFHVLDQSAKAVGRAGSGEVADQGLESLWWNPAAIAGIERDVASADLSLELPGTHDRDASSTIRRPGLGTAPVGGGPDAGDPFATGIVPRLGVAARLGERIAVGATFGVPFGKSLSFRDIESARYWLTRTRLMVFEGQLAAASSPRPWLSLGAAVNVQYARFTEATALPNLSPALPDGNVQLRMGGWDVGWSVGAQLRPNDDVSIGVAYKSRVDHHLDGRVRIEGLVGPLQAGNRDASIEAAFSTPSMFLAGARVRVAPPLTMNVQAVRYGWSAFREIVLQAPYERGAREIYRNNWTFAIGADVDVAGNWTLRGGVQWIDSPARRAGADPQVPDSDRLDFGIGASRRAGTRLTIDAAIAYSTARDVAMDRTQLFYGGTPVEIAARTRRVWTGTHVLTFALGATLTL